MAKMIFHKEDTIMKKALLILGSLFLFTISCNKDNSTNIVINGDQSEEIQASADIIFNLSANHPDGASTRAVKTGWETNDVVYVFFSEQSAPRYLEMKWNGSKWITTKKNSLSLKENETGTMTAVFLPFGSNATVSASGTSFLFDKTYYSYYLTAQLPYIVSEGIVSGIFDMVIPEGYMQFFFDYKWASDAAVIELREPNLIPQGIASIAADGTITTTTLAAGAPLPAFRYDKENKESGEATGYLFSGILASDKRNVPTDYYFTSVWGWGNWETAEYYTKCIADKTFYRGTSEGRAVKLPSIATWTSITTYKPIDVGCDVNGKRVYWCSRNLGAKADFPEEATDAGRRTTYGDYYAWGETTAKNDFTWSTYKYGSSQTELTKYCDNASYGKDGFTDMLTELEASDDAARVNLGGIWRIPTDEELTALRTGCTWTRDYDNRGYAVCISGGTAWTDPTIFLPTSSYKGESGFGMGTGYGFYWSSNIPNNYPYVAYEINFSQSTPPIQHSILRYFGCPIRAVTN